MTFTRSTQMPMMKYIVPGNPIPLQRPRYGHGPRPYDAQKLEKMNFKFHLEEQHGNLPFFTGPLILRALFLFKIPKTSYTRTNLLINTPHIIRPDTDNLLKFIKDCASGILYRDDCIVFDARGVKLLSEEPRTEFVLFPVGLLTKVENHEDILKCALF